MLADFDASGAARHRGSKGTVRESTLLNNHMSKYLPRSVTAVHSGEAITMDGEVSAQCDIMILDPSTPPFWDEDNYRVVPIECVHGVIEGKSFLDSAQLRDAWAKIAGLPNSPKKKGEDHPEFFIDSVWLLNKGGLVWLDPDNGRVDPSPEPRATLASLDAEPGQVLMSLTLHLYEHFATAWMPEFRIIDYFGQAPLGTLGSKWDLEPPEPMPTKTASPRLLGLARGSMRSEIHYRYAGLEPTKPWDGWPAMSGWEEQYPEELEEFPGAARPTPQQISDAIARVPGRAYRPPPGGLGDQVGTDPDPLDGVAREGHRGVPGRRHGERVGVDGTGDEHVLRGNGEEVPPRDGGVTRRGVNYRRSASRSMPISTARRIRSSSQSIMGSAEWDSEGDEAAA
jgi:hypothetical protein